MKSTLVLSGNMLEDAESGIDVDIAETRRWSELNSDTAGRPSVVDGVQTLPKGSDTFQKVLDEIKQEQEAEKSVLENTLDAFMGVKRRKASQTSDRVPRNSKWKLASMKVLNRKLSERNTLNGIT